MSLTSSAQIASYPVMEAFYTIQGEGTFTGQAAYFIRLGGCDVGCVWCDVKDSWNSEKHPTKTVDEIVEGLIAAIPAASVEIKPIVVITGGEPLMHNLNALTFRLRAMGFKVNIETSGSWPLSGYLDWICLSPKKFKAPVKEVIARADELKVIIFNKSDFLWAERFAEMVPASCKRYLQPEWGNREQMMPLIVAYVKNHPNWQISIQTHKYIDVP